MSNPFEGLRPHQPNHVKNLLRPLMTYRGALDASDTGVGKTYTALAIARIFECTPLVLGPKAARAGWEDAGAAMNVQVAFINYEKARRENYGFGYEKEMFKANPLDPEAPPVRCGSYWVWTIKPILMIFDECHLCGGSTSLTGKLLRSANQAAQYTLCLSATAADNPAHLKNIGRALGLFTSQTYMPWLMRHGLKPDYTGNWKLTDDSVELHRAMTKVHKQIFPARGARLRRSEIPGFPETMIDTLLIEPDEKIKEFADQFKVDDLASRMESNKTLEMEIARQLPDYILQSLENKNNVGVFLNFTDALDELAAWASKKKISFGIVDGRQTGEKGDAERRRVLEGVRGGSIPLLLANNRAGGAGMSCHHPTIPADVYIVPSEDGRQMKQVCGRFHRDGGAFSRQFFVGLRGTPQQKILDSNREKIRRIDTLNGDDLESIKFL